MYELVTCELFDREKTHEYILSIQVRLDGFSFSITPPGENRLLASKNVQLKISSVGLISRRFNEWVETEELLQKPFSKIRIVVFSREFTLIPEKHYNATLKQEIPKLLFDVKNEPEIAENSIGKLKTRLIFTLPTGLNDVIRTQIGECEIVHPIKIILNNLPETEKGNGLVLLFETGSFYAIVFNSQKILLANSFKMAAATDVVYYLLTALKQLAIAPSAINIFVANTPDKFQETEGLLLSCFAEIKKLGLVSLASEPAENTD